MKNRCLLVSLLLTAVLLTTRPALAWPEEPFAKVEITGPGISGVAVIIDAALLGSMTIESFMDFAKSIPEPEGLGPGYELHRYFQRPDGSDWDFDRVVFYPDPAGGPGYVYYVEGIGYGPSHHAGKWFRATAGGSAAMQNLLASLDAPAAPVPPASTVTTRHTGLPVSLLAAFIGLLVMVWLAGRQAQRPHIA